MTEAQPEQPINGTKVELKPAPGVVVTAIQVTIDPDKQVFKLPLREPGIIRAAAIWLREPKVLMSRSRVHPIPQPLLFVEVDPSKEYRERTFAFVPTDAVLEMKEGYQARYCVTALGQQSVGHIFEIVEVSA